MAQPASHPLSGQGDQEAAFTLMPHANGRDQGVCLVRNRETEEGDEGGALVAAYTHISLDTRFWEAGDGELPRRLGQDLLG